MSVVHGPPTRGIAPPLRPTAMVLGVALMAATVSFGVHHATPAQAHLSVTALAGVVLAALLAASPVLLAANRRHPAPQLVLVSSDDSAGLHEYDAVADARFGAALHAAELDHGFFVELGPRFLREYHRTFADSPHAVAFVATFSEHPVGILVGVLRPGSHARWVLKHRGARLALAGAAALLVRPRTAWRFAATRAGRYARGWRRRRGQPATTSEEATYAILSHVAVSASARGSGAGAALVGAFERAAAAAGVRELRLVTRPDGGAGPFYERLGWTAGPERPTADGTGMQSYVRSSA